MTQHKLAIDEYSVCSRSVCHCNELVSCVDAGRDFGEAI